MTLVPGEMNRQQMARSSGSKGENNFFLLLIKIADYNYIIKLVTTKFNNFQYIIKFFI